MKPRHWAAIDPIVMAAFARIRPGVDFGDWVERLAKPRTHALILLADDGAPGLQITDWMACVTWRDTPLGRVEYHLRADADMRFELPHARLPETMLHALRGRRVAEILDVPGVGDLVIAGSGVTDAGKQTINVREPASP